jgi:hypothetical protein
MSVREMKCNRRLCGGERNRRSSVAVLTLQVPASLFGAYGPLLVRCLGSYYMGLRQGVRRK